MIGEHLSTRGQSRECELPRFALLERRRPGALPTFCKRSFGRFVPQQQLFDSPTSAHKGGDVCRYINVKALRGRRLYRVQIASPRSRVFFASSLMPFSMLVRTFFCIRSMKRVPLRWSTSCWTQRANNPLHTRLWEVPCRS